jgi:hypothetical protein
MGLFSNILEKLGLGKKKEEAATKPAATTAVGKPSASAAKPTVAKPGATHMAFPVSPRTSVPQMSEVDVVTKFEALAKANPQKLDWKVSIVDLLKLLDLDSSLDARKELAKELGCPADKMGGDYSQMNIWLHKEVVRRISVNGGNIPKDMLN